jgi:hypothetical protein
MDVTTGSRIGAGYCDSRLRTLNALYQYQPERNQRQLSRATDGSTRQTRVHPGSCVLARAMTRNADALSSAVAKRHTCH